MNPTSNPSKLSVRKAYSEQIREKQKAKKNKKLSKVDGNTSKSSLNKEANTKTKINIKCVKPLRAQKRHLNILFEECSYPRVQTDKNLRKTSRAKNDKQTRCIKAPKTYQSMKSIRKEHESTTLKPTNNEIQVNGTHDTLKYQYRIYELKKKLEQ